MLIETYRKIVNDAEDSLVHSSQWKYVFFADDFALAALSEEELLELADCFATAARMFGLKGQLA